MALLNIRLAALRIMGLMPKTNDLEAKDKALRDEYDEFVRFSQSDELKHFNELKEYVHSGEPQRVNDELRNLKYSNSEEYLKEQEYKNLIKSKAFKNYLKVKDSEDLALYQSVDLSGKPFRYKELLELVDSPQYKADRGKHKKENSDEYQKELELKRLKKDRELQRYLKLKRWQPLLDYFEVEKGTSPERFEELKGYVSSNEFNERKAYLNSSKKYQQSEAFAKVKEYEGLKKSNKIKWFFKLQDSNKFDEIKRWELTFEDSFDQKELDSTKWMKRYFWGEAILNKSYSLATDMHCYTDGGNVSIDKGVLMISTRKEKAEGLAWDYSHGFVPRSFDYTSGIISTGNFFRQQRGRFEAKVRLRGAPGVYHAFWLVGDTMLPEIDIFRQEGKNSGSFQSAYFWQNGQGKANSNKSKVNGINLNQDFFILSVDWLADRLIWKVNGVTVKEQTGNLPEGPAYVVLSSGINAKTSEEFLPTTLEVDWVRCWKEVEQK